MTGDTGAIQIERQRRVRDWSLGYTVWIDDEAVGEVRSGDIRRYLVTPGPHRVRVGLAGRFLGGGRFWTSELRTVQVGAGQTVVMTCLSTPVSAAVGLVRPSRRLRLAEADR